MDDDAEGEEDYEENGDDVGDEDKQIYCFCQKLSYGEVRILFRSRIYSVLSARVDDCLRQPGVCIPMGESTLPLH